MAAYQGGMMPPPPAYGSAPGMPVGDVGGSSNEELIEAIIDEKWNELVKDVNKIVAWKEAMTAHIERIEQRLNDLKGQFDQLHQAVIGKIGEYDKHIVEVGSEVQAMEKVFSKVLPAFTENIGELSRITARLKGATPKRSAPNPAPKMPNS
ncbi:hypothetical protein D6789_03265 [Candidatus Woesearchaeota archaeon]|nr:MAG: hypothetical protein D6789_03265 [Candidatus Woesearchaeota archaeon]